jgi:hypothetical protein
MRPMHKAALLKAHGSKIGRAAMSQKVIEAVAAFNRAGQSPKAAMELAGRLKAVASMATGDEYWREKMENGFELEFRKALSE